MGKTLIYTPDNRADEKPAKELFLLYFYKRDTYAMAYAFPPHLPTEYRQLFTIRLTISLRNHFYVRKIKYMRRKKKAFVKVWLVNWYS